MLALAAKARGSGKQAQKKDRDVASPTMKISSPSPSTTAVFKDHVEHTEKEDVAPIFASPANVPSRSGLGGTIPDEVVSRFAASCPGGDLTNMAKLPTDILVTNGASVLAKIDFHLLSCYPFLPSGRY